MNILLFSGSLRKDSLNKKLLKVAETILVAENKFELNLIDIKSLNIPVYDGDVETQGIPVGVSSLGEAVKKADAIIIASPEYNSSIAGPLKNTIDWVSRLRPIPWEGKPILLMGASPGGFGAIRALGVTRAPFEALGSYVFPQTFALPKASEAFSETGGFTDAGNEKRLKQLIQNYLVFAQKFSK